MQNWHDKLLGGNVDRQKLLRNGGSYAILFVAMGSMVFFGICSPRDPSAQSTSSLSGAAAKVDGDTIRDIEFRRNYASLAERYQRQFGEGFDPALFQLSKSVLNQLVDQRIMLSEARKAGVVVADAEVERILADAEVFKDEQGKFSGERFETYLRRNQYSEASFSQELRQNLSGEKLRSLVQDSYYTPKSAVEWAWRLSETKLDLEYLKFDPAKLAFNISDEEAKAFLDDKGKIQVKDYYEKNSAEFHSKGKVKASHILIAFEGARNASGDAKLRPKDEAKSIATRIHAEASAAQADFAKLATQYSDDPSGKSKGGDLGFFEREAMVKEFSDVAFAMKAGELSQVVESPFGFHIIKVDALKAATSSSLEEASPGIAKKLIERERRPKAMAEGASKVLAALKDKLSEVDSLLKANQLAWQSTGSFAIDQPQIPGLGGEASLRDAAFSLTTAVPLYPEVISVGDIRYIIRLKSRTAADLGQLNAAKREELADSLRSAEAYSLFDTFKSSMRERLQKAGKIWLNPDFENYDQRRKEAADAGT